jgi:hypothetical protein
MPSGAPSDGELCTRLRELCQQTRKRLGPGPAADGVDAVRYRLSEPTLRIAVGGRLKAGKSTLVNALLGQQLAATAVTECTLIVAWFRYAPQNRVEVHCHDGRVYRVPGEPGGGVPRNLAMLGATRKEIAEIVVEVANERLGREYTVIDTPGTDSLTGLDSVAMEAFAQADALLYVTPHPGEKDAEVLHELRQLAAAHGINTINVLGVLSRADQMGDGISDPWPVARRLAKRCRAQLAGLVGDVIPVAGLLAQTVLGDQYTEADTGLLRRLAVVRQDDLMEALFDHESFRQWADCPLTLPERQRLLDLLGRYGINLADTAIRSAAASGSRLSTADLLTILRGHTGVDQLLDRITTHFLASADRLRAAAAIATLTRLAASGQSQADAAAMRAMRTQLAELRQHPLILQTELSPVLADMSAGRLRLPDNDAHALRLLATASDAALCLGLEASAGRVEVAEAADAEIRRWQRFEWSYSLKVRQYAGIARQICEAFFFAAERQSL